MILDWHHILTSAVLLLIDRVSFDASLLYHYETHLGSPYVKANPILHCVLAAPFDLQYPQFLHWPFSFLQEALVVPLCRIHDYTLTSAP